jgi:CBS-domain-containing membrane protein
VVTIDASATLVEAAQRMREANVGVLPVIQDGVIRGVVTDRDLVVRAIAQEADPRATRVGDCATVELLVAHADWDTDRALELMARHQIGRLPVVDAADRPIGIVMLSSLALRAREDAQALSAARKCPAARSGVDVVPWRAPNACLHVPSGRGARPSGSRRAAGLTASRRGSSPGSAGSSARAEAEEQSHAEHRRGL